MWSQYDENLDENPFFKFIQENHCDIIEKVSQENWITCVPRIGTFKPEEISVDTIFDHILVFGSKEGYNTLSKKQLILKNRHIYMDISSCYSDSVEILFEETFYISKNTKYIVWCIERPLFLKYNYCDSHKTVFLENLHDCIDFLWAESLGHGVLDNVKELSEKFICEHEDIEMEDLQTLKELVGALYSQCLQVGMKNEFIREKSRSSSLFLDNFKLSVETYMQHCLGKRLMFCFNTLQYQTDAFLNKILRNSTEVQFQDLGVTCKFLDNINPVKNELSKINGNLTILDKVNCLRRVFNAISDNGECFCVTADQVLQVLVFLILKLNVNNWTANMIFIREFRFSLADNSDQHSFFITTLEAALEFIKSNQFLDIKKTNNNLDSVEVTANYIREKIKSGELKSLTNLLNTERKTKGKLCHPLCSCEKCHDTVISDTDHPNFSTKICNNKGQDLLIVSSILGYREVVEFLLGQGFQVESKDCFNKTSLHYAAARGLQDILLVLINHKANVNAVDTDKNSPLHLACENGQENCVKALIYSSGDVELNVGNKFGDTPLHLATKWGFFDIIKALLENGASVIIKNKRKQTVLNLAPNYHVLKLFQHFGVERSSTILKQITGKQLSHREERPYPDQCKDHGIRPKNIDQYKKIDLLLKAIENNDLPLTCFYLGFSSSTSGNSKSSSCHPLCTCERCQNDDSENSIMPDSRNACKGININMCNVNGSTPLHVAAKFGRTEILRLLLDCGAAPNVKTYKTLLTPLHLACLYQRVQIVRELLKCGECSVDENDSDSNTPLFYACEKNDVKIVEILLCNGADCNKKNCLGKSSLIQSQEKMHYRVFKLMKNSLVNNLDKESLCKDDELF